MFKATLIGLLLGLGYILLKPKREEKEDFDIDYYSPHYLRFSDETNLNERFLPFESAVNMRDAGGYTNAEGRKLKKNKIYRGEELCHLNEEDQKAFNDLGIDYIIDFRESDKAANQPDNVPPGAKYLNIPVLEGLSTLKLDYSDPQSYIDFFYDIYRAQVRKRADRFAKALKLLRDDKDTKIYVHCTNGKDRTGIMIALIQLIAGIPKEKIISDYSLSNLTYERAYELLNSTVATETGVNKRDLMKFFGVDPSWLEEQLDWIEDNYGNVDNYLIANTDLTREDIEKIRENLLE